jgi:hypothetical protein
VTARDTRTRKQGNTLSIIRVLCFTASTEGRPVGRDAVYDAVAQPSAKRGSRVAQCVRAGEAEADACTRRAGGAACVVCEQGRRPPPRRETRCFFRSKRGGKQSWAYSSGFNSSFRPIQSRQLPFKCTFLGTLTKNVLGWTDCPQSTLTVGYRLGIKMRGHAFTR